MRVFGTKQPEPTDADRAAAARLSALAARFRPDPSLDAEVEPIDAEPVEPDDPDVTE